MPKEITSVSQFDDELKAAGSKLVVVDFHATWCGPCKVIAPTFASLAQQTSSAVFFKVDVDRVQPIAQRYRVLAMPTFVFLKNGNIVDTLKGANAGKLTALVKQHSTGGAFSGAGQTLSGSSSSSNSAPAGPDGHSSVLHLVEPNQSAALNEKSSHTLHDIIKGPSGGKWLESDADEQLLIQLSFKQTVKISSILLRTTPSHVSSAPKHIKLFLNRPSLSFEDAVNETADQEIQLSGDQIKSQPNGGGGKPVALRFVKFQNVNSLSIFVLSNQDDQETTRIDAIDLFGVVSEATNMNDLTKIQAQGRLGSEFDRPESRNGLKGGSSRGISMSSIPATYNRPPFAQKSFEPTKEQASAPKSGRRGSTASSASFVESESGSGSVPASPPFLSTADEDEFESANAAALKQETFGGWHYAPLAIALAPPLGAVIGGRADAWSDVILLLLASFWLYQFLRVPWEMYYSARTRRILSHDYDDELQQDGDAGENGETESKRSNGGKGGVSDAEKLRIREAAAAELRRSELMSLLFCIISPLVGAWMLNWMRETMVDGSRYLNAFNIRLFTLAAGIKPWSHAIKLIRRRMLHLQEEVHYPSSKVETLSKRICRLEADLNTLRKMYATKNDIRGLRDVDTQLGRAIRRSERKEEHLRLSAEDKFSMVEGRLEDLLREVAINAELIEEERREREKAASLRISLFEAIKFLLGAGITIRRGTPRHYLYDAPRSLPSTASLGIGMGSPTKEQPVMYPLSQSTSLSGLGQSVMSPPSLASNFSSPTSGGDLHFNGTSSPPDTSSPPAGGNNHFISKRASQRVSNSWWGRGLSFYLFLPLHVFSSVIRIASEKVRSILEDTENEAAHSIKHKKKLFSYQQHLAEQQNKQQQQQPSQPRFKSSGPSTSSVAVPCHSNSSSLKSTKNLNSATAPSGSNQRSKKSE